MTEERRKHPVNTEKSRKRKQVHPTDHEKSEGRKSSRPAGSGKGERRKEIRQGSSQSPAPVRVLHTGEAATKSTEKSGRTLYRLGSSGFSAGFTTIVSVYEKIYCPTDWKNSQIPSCQNIIRMVS